jgi:hypothetical protein
MFFLGNGTRCAQTPISGEKITHHPSLFSKTDIVSTAKPNYRHAKLLDYHQVSQGVGVNLNLLPRQRPIRQTKPSPAQRTELNPI